jgi:hypothetical protein
MITCPSAGKAGSWRRIGMTYRFYSKATLQQPRDGNLSRIGSVVRRLYFPSFCVGWVSVIAAIEMILIYDTDAERILIF